MVVPSAPFQVLLLGPAETRWYDSLFSIPRQTPRTLLFYLASRGSLTPRNELLTLFWPEEEEAIARLRLRETLNKLRKALPEPTILLSTADLVGLDLNVTYVDLLEFRELTTQVGRLPWKIPPDEPLPNPLYLKMLRAYQLWRGANLLAGFELTSSIRLDAWFSTTANHNEALYRRITERLSDHEAAVGNLDTALSMARQALVNNELEENLHVRVLRLLIQMGSTREARQYYQEVRALFQKEMNTQPGPELQALAEQIKSHTVPVAQQAKAQWNIHASLQVPFVGRQKYIQDLRQAYQKGGGVFILGESGQGKTRLLKEFTSQLNPTPRLLLAQCRPMEFNLPFQPLIDVLRQQVSPREWLSLPAIWAEQLQLLFPELNQLRSDLRRYPIATQEQNRTLLLEGVHQLFMILGKNQRILMILDDAQWADEASLGVLAYLLERPPFQKDACLIVAARQEEENPYLDNLLTQVKRSKDIPVLHLPQMEVNEIDDLVQQVMGAPADARFVLKLSQDTGGNPFFILETLYAILKQQIQPDLASLDALPLATNVYNLIRQRVQVLSPGARALLEIAAISGREFNTTTLIKASGFSEDMVAAAIDELEERLLVIHEEPPAGSAQYRFIHDKFREAFLLDLSPVRAQIIHRKIAFALSSEPHTPHGSQAAILASHFEAGGEWYLAYQQWSKAGQYARRLYAITDATRAFKKAEQLIDRCLTQLNDEQIYDLYREWGEMAYAANDTAALQAMNSNLMRLGEELHSSLLTGTAFVRLGNACFSSGKLEEGLEYTRLAIQELDKTNHTHQLIGAKTNYGVFLYMASHGSQAIQVFEEALNLLDDDPKRDNLYHRANLLYEIGFCQIMCGHPQKGRDFGLQSLKYYQLLDNLDGAAAALADLTLAEYFLGNYPQAALYSQRGLENAQQAHSWRMLGYHSNYRAMLDFAAGDLDSMLEHTEKAIELGQRIGRTDIASIAYRLIGDAFYFLQDYQKDLDYLQIAYENGKNTFLAFDAQYRIQASQFILDQQERYIQGIKDIIAQIEVGGMATGILHAQMSLAMAYFILHKWQEARSLAEDIKKIALTRGFHSFVCAGNLILAQCEWSVGNHSQAFSLLRESIEEAGRISFVWLEINGRILLNHFLKQVGEPLDSNRTRIGHLLKHIQDHCHKDFFQPALRSYFEQINQILA